MAKNKVQKKTVDFGGLAQGLFKYLQQAAASPPWVELRRTGVWPKVEIPELEQITAKLAEEFDKTMEELNQRYNERCDEIKEVVEKRRQRLESFAKRQRQMITPVEKKFIVAGRVTNKGTGVGLPNVRINAFDEEHKHDETLGATRTNEFGYFRIEHSADVLERIGEKRKTYIEVLSESGEPLYTSTKSFVPQSNKTTFITATIEGDKVPESSVLGNKIDGSVNNRIKELDRRKRMLEPHFASRLVEKKDTRIDTPETSSKLDSDQPNGKESVKKRKKKKKTPSGRTSISRKRNDQ